MTPPSFDVAVVAGFCGGGGRDEGNSRPPCGIALGVGW